MKATFLSLICVSLVLITGAAFRAPKSSLYQFDYENVLGTSLQLKIAARSEKIADQAEQLALSEIDRLAGILSTYDPDSEISQWQHTQNLDVRVSPELFEILQLFDTWKQKTSGAVTASIGTASALWKKAEQQQQPPTEKDLQTAVKAMLQPHWQLNQKYKTARHISTQPLVLNSFVKSYIIGKVSNKIMNLQGVEGSVVNIGGDIVIAGSIKEKVSISNPVADAENALPVTILNLQQQAIATSGNYRRGFQIGNLWYSHIIDPRTAKPATGITSATVVGPDASMAGALATALNVLSHEDGIVLAEQFPQVEYQIITNREKIFTSKNWGKFQIKNESPLPETKPGFSYQPKGKLNISIELAQFEGRFRRPFVAAWIENDNKELVKSIALWYNKPRWLPDLKRWYAKHQSVMQDIGTAGSISSATRSAGKYTFTWEGQDNSGKPAPAGTYTIFIEAAREHGTYQLLQQQIEWNGKAKHFELEGGVEITTASLDLTK